VFVGAIAPSGNRLVTENHGWSKKCRPYWVLQHLVTTEGYHNMGDPGLSAMSIEKIPKTIN